MWPWPPPGGPPTLCLILILSANDKHLLYAAFCVALGPHGRKWAGRSPEGPSQLGDTASYGSQSTPRAQQGDRSGCTRSSRQGSRGEVTPRSGAPPAGAGEAEPTLRATSWRPRGCWAAVSPALGVLLRHCGTSGPLLQAAHRPDPSCPFVPVVTSRSTALPGAGSRAASHELAGQSAGSRHQLRHQELPEPP